MHHRAELTDDAALRLDDLIRADETGGEAGYIEAASSAEYRSAWRKCVFGGEPDRAGMSERERAAIRAVQQAEGYRALGIATGPIGNYAVPVQLDPTVILTSGGSINPLRSLARTETVFGNVWEGVTSAGITATFTAEATEVADANPQLGQPVANVEKAQAFIPFSIDIGQDWAQLEEQMALLFADAKANLEADKFVKGVGHGSNVPEGLLVGGTAIVSTAAATTLATGDLYALKEALPLRFRPNAKYLASDVILDRVRRLVGPGNTTEGPLFEDGDPPRILRRGAYEQSSMPTTMTSGSSIITYGDFTQFLIADRVGASVELIPHLFATANNLPSGQRGLYFFWRTTSKVLSSAAFKTLKVT